MKKLWIQMIVLLMILSMTGCAKESAPTEPPVETQAATDAPFIDTQITEPEWTLAEGELRLEGQDKIYAESTDVLYFAIVTANDGTQELRFRISDETAAKLAAQSVDNSYHMTFNGENIGAATLNSDCTVATVSAKNASEEVTVLATRIRGLAKE